MGSSTTFGSGNYIDFAGFTPSAADWTYAAWFNWDGTDTGTFDSIVGQNTGDELPLYFSTQTAAPDHVRSFVSGIFLKGSTLVTSSKWWFTASSYNATSDDWTLYLGDGDSMAAVEDSSVSEISFNGTSRSIGRYFTGGNVKPWHGEIAQVHMYNVELTLEELREIQFKPLSILNGLEAYYPLYTGSPEDDISGNGHDGTVTGSLSLSTSGPPIFFPSLTT